MGKNKKKNKQNKANKNVAEAKDNKETETMKTNKNSGKDSKHHHKTKKTKRNDDDDDKPSKKNETSSLLQQVMCMSDDDSDTENNSGSDNDTKELAALKQRLKEMTSFDGNDGDSNDDDTSFQEVDLDDDSDDEDEEPSSIINEKSDDSVNEKSDDSVNVEEEETEKEHDEEIVADDGDASNERQEHDDYDSSDTDNEEDEGSSKKQKTMPSISEKNALSHAALLNMAQRHKDQKAAMPFAETFVVVSNDAMPLDGKNIHDDLKREVTFYNTALAAVEVAKTKCAAANIPFTRPDDFFAEMIKTDEHMAKVKDRLIFETKKIDAVAQRKSGKEQKLRAKESHAHKLAEKAKRRKDHHSSVQDWANTAAGNRGNGKSGNDADDGWEDKYFGGNDKSKQRQYYDTKYGHGGKRGRFKQNDPKTHNDMRGYNPNGGNFQNGQRKYGGGGNNSGGNRAGKRARDASRSRART